MKNHRTIRLLTLLALMSLLPLTLAGCRSRTDRSEGNVLLSIASVNDVPSVVNLGDDTSFDLTGITVRNIAKDPSGTSSELQSIELRTLEIRYQRRDSGSRVPPANVQSVFGLVPFNGTFTLPDVAFLTSDQVLSQPLKDLRDTGRDSETGTAVVVLDVSMRVFGRTLSGDDIVSDPARFTIEVRP